MSSVGAFRTCRDVRIESAFGGKTDVSFQGCQVRFRTGPKTDVGIDRTTM
jgi:hypothetical protein